MGQGPTTGDPKAAQKWSRRKIEIIIISYTCITPPYDNVQFSLNGPLSRGRRFLELLSFLNSRQIFSCSSKNSGCCQKWKWIPTGPSCLIQCQRKRNYFECHVNLILCSSNRILIVKKKEQLIKCCSVNEVIYCKTSMLKTGTVNR